MGTGKKKIEIKLKEREQYRRVTFSKRRQGLFKKASVLRSTTGADIAVITFSPAGRPYVHGDPSFDAVIERYLQSESINGEAINRDDGEAKVKSWLEALEGMDAHGGVGDLLLMKHKVEEIVGKICQQIDLHLADSFVDYFLV